MSVAEALERLRAGDEAGAWAVLDAHPLDDADEAVGLAVLAGDEALDRERRLVLAHRVLLRWGSLPAVLVRLGDATESLVDRRFLNAAPPADPYFDAVIHRLQGTRAWDDDPDLAGALATACRVRGRLWDDLADRAHRAVIAAEPHRWTHRYNYGLFLKNRGRFEEGLEANERAAAGGGADDEAVRWNLGICATGAGRGERALEVWRELGFELELGEDGLPFGRFPLCQVRVAERPIAARGAQRDDPGEEETIWVEPHSPCHGRVLSATLGDLGVDSGDVVLWDGAPIATRLHGDREVSVFPQLVALRSGGHRVFRFAGTQEHPEQIADHPLPGGAHFYVHTEMVRQVCAACAERREVGHTHDAPPSRVVTGKIVVPPEVPLADVGELLGRLPGGGHPAVACPGLWEALGDGRRAAIDDRRFDLLVGSRA